jgi:ubiquinone/menaquinone biosynthesis C-methylase UbiE
VTKNDRERAYLYDLYIAPTWRDCFDRLFNESLGLPQTGNVLTVNCGTGGHALEIAGALAHRGKVTAIDAQPEMIELARAKAAVQELTNLEFICQTPGELTFAPNSFDFVLSDVSLFPQWPLAAHLAELKRFICPNGSLALHLATRGSFDEFFSIFWEALYECHLAEDLLPALEGLINLRPTIAEVEASLQKAGFKQVRKFQRKEEFTYKTAEDFFSTPLIADYMLTNWLDILPKQKINRVQLVLQKIIERELQEQPFAVSLKAAVFVAQKPA